MSDDRDLPTIKQICHQADWIGDEPMSEEESAEWFARTAEENRERRTSSNLLK